MTKAHARSAPDPWLVLAGLSLGVLVTNGLGRFAYGLILPAMRADLNWTYAQAGWLNTANAMGYVLGAVTTMIALRRWRPNTLFSAGLIGTVLAITATGLIPDLWWQSLWRFLTGFAGALSFSTAGALAARLFADNPRRNAMGIAILFGSGGGAAIILIGGTLPALLHLGGNEAWPWAWVITGGLGLICVPLGLWAARASRAPQGAAQAPTPLPLRRMAGELAGYAGFGLGYIVYLTFLSAWMTEQSATPLQISLVWILLGACITLSPLLWRGVFARDPSGKPLAKVLICIALGSALPVFWPTLPGLTVSALIFGSSVFMAPPAITNFTRQNLPPESWGRALSLFTVVFAVAQTIGPYAAGVLGDSTGSIGTGLLAGSAILVIGAVIAMRQSPL